MDSNEKEETLRTTSARATGKGHGRCPGHLLPLAEPSRPSRRQWAATRSDRSSHQQALGVSRRQPGERGKEPLVGRGAKEANEGAHFWVRDRARDRGNEEIRRGSAAAAPDK